jgi:hypothetical protein
MARCIKGASRVHRHLHPGLLEAIVQDCRVVLRNRHLSALQQGFLPLHLDSDRLTRLLAQSLRIAASILVESVRWVFGKAKNRIFRSPVFSALRCPVSYAWNITFTCSLLNCLWICAMVASFLDHHLPPGQLSFPQALTGANEMLTGST